MSIIAMLRNDDLLGAKKEFTKLMATKVGTKIEDLKKTVGANLYNKKETD